MTEEEIIKIWNSIPPQGDPTGKKFAVKFAQEIERKVLQGLEDDVESAIQDLIKISEGKSSA